MVMEEETNWKHTYEVLRREMIEMAKRASSEIKDLRRNVERLAPKADAYDTLRQVLDMAPRRSQSMSEDVAWRLDQRVEQLLEEERPKKPQSVG
jgi:hypothetical protein